MFTAPNNCSPLHSGTSVHDGDLKKQLCVGAKQMHLFVLSQRLRKIILQYYAYKERIVIYFLSGTLFLSTQIWNLL